MYPLKEQEKQLGMLGNRFIFFFFFALLGTDSSGNLTVMLRSNVAVKILRIKFSLSSFFLLLVQGCLLLVGAGGILADKENTFI